jgi:hypothetical protein
MGMSGRFVVLVVLLVLGSWGWGRAGTVALRRAGWKAVTDAIGPPLQILLGVSMFVSVGGFLVAVGVATFSILIGWHVVGALFMVVPLITALQRGPRIRLRTALVATGAAIAAIALFLLSLTVAIRPLYNLNDDDAAYIYLAKRLLSTGGLIDAFNQRRITSYGGNSLYHALFLHVAGTSSVRGYEFVFAALILVLATVGTIKRRWLLPGAFLVGVGVLLGHGTGAVLNVSPTFSVAGLSLGAYQLLRHVRVPPDDEQPLLYVVIGLFLAGVLALRFTFLLSVAIAVVIVVVVVRGRRAITPLAIAAGSTVIAVSGWAIALLRSSATPLFPLISGNYNSTWPGAHDPMIKGLNRYAHLFGNTFNSNDVGIVALLSAVTALALVFLTRRQSLSMLVLFGAGIGCLAQLAALVYVFSGSDIGNIARFEGPSTLACGLLAVDTLWLRTDERVRRTASGPEGRPGKWRVQGALRRLDPTRLEVSARNMRRLFVSSVMTVVLVVLAGLTFGYSVPSWRSWFDATRSGIHAGYEVAAHSQGFVDRYAKVAPQYRRLNALVPPGAKVLAAVTYPALLDFSKYQFATLDLVGGASPPPHMPFFVGAQAKVAYLRALGYQYIVAVSPQEPGLYQLRSWLNNYRGSVYAYRAWTPYFVDWQSTVNDLERNGHFSVRYSGSLALIRIG